MTAGRTIVSENQNWCTPPIYVEAVRKFFDGQIDLDPCSNKHSVVNALVEFRLPEQDGLKLPWRGKRIYVNPPYGADRDRGTTIKHWLARCVDSNTQFSSEVLALVPVATNTSHWKQYVWGKASAIAFLYDTRLKFLVDGQGGGKGAPMSCSMVYWGDRVDAFDTIFSGFGAVVDLRSIQGRLFGAQLKPQHEMLLEVRESTGPYKTTGGKKRSHTSLVDQRKNNLSEPRLSDR